MASQAEMVCDGTICRKESLGLSWRCGPLQASFQLMRELAGILGTVVQIGGAGDVPRPAEASVSPPHSFPVDR